MRERKGAKSGYLPAALLQLAIGSVAAAAICGVQPAMAADTVFSGEFNTLLRMQKDQGKRNIYPVLEYVRVQASKTLKDDSEVSLQFGGWGRLDLADKSSSHNTDGDLQYALVSYRNSKNNFAINAGRQFVAEGVATEIMDGLYVRQDFLYGFAAAAYVGKPVMTANQEKEVDLVYGGRISHAMPKYYNVGFSLLKSDQESRRYREEFGADLLVTPLDNLDLTGRSSYNNITSGWMEHNYNLAYSPLESLRLSLNSSQINYKDYFHNMTLSAFSLKNGILNPAEKLFTLGGSAAYTPFKSLTITADYKNHSYDILGDANYFGGKASYQITDSILSGAGIYRMDGNSNRLRYSEARGWVAAKFGKTDISADFIALLYDRAINGIKESFTVVGAAAHNFGRKLKVGADIEYSRTPDFDNQLCGMLKFSYLFDTAAR